jgi:hypothetical protein
MVSTYITIGDVSTYITIGDVSGSYTVNHIVLLYYNYSKCLFLLLSSRYVPKRSVIGMGAGIKSVQSDMGHTVSLAS